MEKQPSIDEMFENVMKSTAPTLAGINAQIEKMKNMVIPKEMETKTILIDGVKVDAILIDNGNIVYKFPNRETCENYYKSLTSAD